MHPILIDKEYEDADKDDTEAKPSFRPRPRASARMPKRERELLVATHNLARVQAEIAQLRKQVQREEGTKKWRSDNQAPDKLMPIKYAGLTDFNDYLVQFETIAELHG